MTPSSLRDDAWRLDDYIVSFGKMTGGGNKEGNDDDDDAVPPLVPTFESILARLPKLDIKAPPKNHHHCNTKVSREINETVSAQPLDVSTFLHVMKEFKMRGGLDEVYLDSIGLSQDSDASI